MDYLRKSAIEPELLARARAMRKNSAPAEHKLWELLRNRQLNGFKFRRQHNVGPFIADFYCDEARLVVELDGDSHATRAEYDASRTIRIERDGYHVIRFLNSDVFDFTDSVLEEILCECETFSQRRPSS
jgi:very-short-patch-repair endonuclease